MTPAPLAGLESTEEERKDKRRSDDSGRQERTRHGLYFVFYVLQSSAFILCLFILFRADSLYM